MIRRILPILALACLSATAAETSKPNILFIMADDVGYGDLGCYGAKLVKTPTLDKLAAQGCRFTDAHSPAATCTPTRRAFLTGTYSWRQQPGSSIAPGDAAITIEPGTVTVASLMKQAGYRTGIVGKWHLGLGGEGGPNWNGDIKPSPLDLGFDSSFIMAATGDRVPTVYVDQRRIVGLDPADPISVSYKAKVGTEPTGQENPDLLKLKHTHGHDMTIVNGVGRIGWMTGGKAARWRDEDMADTFAKQAVKFIEESTEKPFFLFFATHGIHVPRVPNERFVGSSQLGARGDAIHELDDTVSQVLAALEKRGITDNTLVIFTSDNGPVLYDGYYDGSLELNRDHRPAGPWRGGKYSAWEGGTRMPFIVSWPGTVKPGRSDALFSQVDLLASLAKLTGATVPSGTAVDSRELLDTLLGKSETGRDHVIQQGVKMESIRQGDWKYVPPGNVTNRAGVDRFQSDLIRPPGALFFLPEDPEEQNDVASLYPDKVRQLRAILEAELGRQTGQDNSSGDGLGGAVRK